MFIGLSTCPHHESGNVGDQLITDASIKLIKDIHGDTDINVHFRREDFTSRLDYVNSSDGILCFGFPILESSTRPNMYRIAEDLAEVEVPIIPIGAAHNFYPGDKEELESRELNSSTKSFLDQVVQNCPNGEMPVRTEWVGQMLRQNGYKTVLTGDPAWYDPEFTDKEFHKPDDIDQLVFTTPHSSHYIEQAEELLRRLARQFSDADRIMILHSAPTDVDRELFEPARSTGWDIHYASHNVENLNLYRESDLHVGYRKHGHLAHLRWRRPSIVLAEDSRAQGLNETLGTAGFPAFEAREGALRQLGEIHDSIPVKGIYFALRKLGGYDNILPSRKNLIAPPNPTAIDDVFGFIRYQRQNQWEAFDHVQDVIDNTYNEGMKPFLESVIHSPN